MTFLKKPIVLLVLPLAAVLFSCTARIDGVVRHGGAADITVSATLQPGTAALVRTIRGFMGGGTADANAPLLDAAMIGRSITAAPGVSAASFANENPSAINGRFSIASIGDFLDAGDSEGRFIAFTEGAAAGASSIALSLDRDSAPRFISHLSPELSEYLAALMAPVVSGEDVTKQEYLNIATMVYGRVVADEIAAATIRVSIEFPRSVTAVQGGAARGNRAEFDIPLVDLLVLENPLQYEVRW
ncbi:MAG: hypothetical protein FWD91_00330 [Treponema sp.]|nr:hypothetical protein [Treponema sp.]